MKFKSVSVKLNIAIIGVSLISLIVASYILFHYADKINNEVYENTKNELRLSAEDKIESKMRVGITNAISIANDDRIKNAFRKNERGCAIKSFTDISNKMRENTDFKNIKIHLHTKDNISFVRNWKPQKYGDDLSSFRAAVVAVNKTKKSITSFESGRAGLLLRAITPVMDNNGEHYGSLEFIQGINSVVKSFDREKIGFLLLMDNSVNADMKTDKNFSFKDEQKFKNYIISQKFINKEFIDDAKNIDLETLFKNGYFIDSKYFYTYITIKDFQNKKLGIALLGKPLFIVNKAIDGAKELIYISLVGIFAMMVIINLVMILAIRILITNPLERFENALLDFFMFLQGKKDYTNNLSIDTDDEFGVMAKSLSENISVSAKLHEEINDLNNNLSSKVEEKTSKITTLLNNAGQGFLTFDKSLTIDDEYSSECNKLLGDSIGGKDISQILFKDPKKIEFFRNTISDCVELQDNIIKRSILSLLPSEIILNKRALKLEYRVLEEDRFMLILTNISAQKSLEKKIKNEQTILKMIVAIVSDSDTFYDTKKDYEEFCGNYREYINDDKTSLHNISEIYRTIHTFKGTFSQLYMQNTVTFLHNIESSLSDMIKSNEHDNETILELLENSSIEASLEKDLSIIKDILGDEFLNYENFIKISHSEIQTLQDKICNLFRKSTYDTPETKDIIEHVKSLSNHKLYDMLKPYTNLVQQLSSRLDKEIYEFDIIGDKNIMVSNELKPFIKSLIHLFRNSVDHGIETPETRVENDKDEIGTISCSFEIIDDEMQIVISDDGTGINKELIVKKAIDKEIINEQEAQQLSDEEIYELIFHDNFSTKEEISDISGRGVGMSAIKAELEQIDGRCSIKSKLNTGTTFVFRFPYQNI